MTAGIPPATIVFYAHKQDHNPEYETLPWESADEASASIVDLFSEHELTDCVPCPGGQQCAKKNGLAYSPGVPRRGTTRRDENTEFVSLLVFDIDHVSQMALRELSVRMAHLEMLVSSTHSHQWGGPDDCCVRLILPLQRQLKPDEFRVVYRQVSARFKIASDPAAKDPSRLYFLPSAPAGSTPIAIHQRGALLDIDELLIGAPPLPIPLPRGSAPHHSSLPNLNGQAVDMEAFREALLAYDKRIRDDSQEPPKKELARRIATGSPLTTPQEARIRHISCVRAGRILAWTLPKDVDDATVVELIRPSVMGMPAFDGDSPREEWCDSAFATILGAWRGGLKTRDAKEEELAARNTQMAERFRKLKGHISRASAREVEVDGGEEEPAAGEDDDRFEDWEEHLITVKKKDGSETIDSLDFNAILILSADDEWRRVLRYNEVAKTIDIVGGPLETHERDPSVVTTAIKSWLQKEYGVKMRTNDLMSDILLASRANMYNPLQEYLNGCKHDGQSRIDTFLERYCAASTTSRSGEDITAHVRRISRRWLISAVARAMSPGCKVDTVLILEGVTDLYKSTALKVLGGKFFSDSKITIGSNDAMMLAGTNWIHEIAELTSFHASETEVQKAFFSSATDNFRPPYGHSVQKFDRLCVFVGSTNDDRYMNDPTGNRRYWPIHCDGRFQIKELREDRDLIWAEAVAVYKAAAECTECDLQAEHRCAEHRWWLDPEENKVLEKVNNFRLKAEYAEAIADYVLKLSKESRARPFTIYEVATDVLKLTPDRIASQQVSIGRALKVLGFKKDRPTENGITITYYVAPDSLQNAVHKTSARRHLSLVTKPDEPVVEA